MQNKVLHGPTGFGFSPCFFLDSFSVDDSRGIRTGTGTVGDIDRQVKFRFIFNYNRICVSICKIDQQKDEVSLLVLVQKVHNNNSTKLTYRKVSSSTVQFCLRPIFCSAGNLFGRALLIYDVRNSASRLVRITRNFFLTGKRCLFFCTFIKGNGVSIPALLLNRETVSLFLHFTVNPKPPVGFLDVPRCSMTGKEQTVCRSVHLCCGPSGSGSLFHFGCRSGSDFSL